LLAVVNAGISPGLTDVLTGYLINKHNITPISYNLYLDENFNSMVPLFSWSPSVALDEVLTPAFVLDDGAIRFDKPFTLIGYCVGNKCFNYYEVTQEELLNMYHHYKDSLRSLKVAV
jgi:saccharopine dehydrogenase-like NADP-dependent oxidoreductase